MSKDLQNEYLNMLEQEELPDLWGRISSGLPEKNQVSGMEEKRSVTEKAGYQKKKRNIYRWSTVMAASICLLVMIPVVYQMSWRGKSDELDMDGSVVFKGEQSKQDEAIAYESVQMEEACETEQEYDFGEEADVLFMEQEIADETKAVPDGEAIWVKVHVLSFSTDDTGVSCFEAEIEQDHQEAGLKAGEVITIRDEASVGKQLNLEGKEAELEIIPSGEKIFILKNVK